MNTLTEGELRSRAHAMRPDGRFKTAYVEFGAGVPTYRLDMLDELLVISSEGWNVRAEDAEEELENLQADLESALDRVGELEKELDAANAKLEEGELC